MRVLPDKVTHAWIETLTDEDLVDVEARVHARFAVLERQEKKARGARYELCRGSAALMAEWDLWSRLANATRERSLTPRRASA